ncbi:MAG: gamma-glutamylcyclotransferase family protein [Gracilimonas sp.]|nr:gamma-glutamylcyclotransferase family protein [Gracilimonas sp.]
MKSSTFLFVYGTLKRGFNNQVAEHLHRTQTFVGEGSFPGKLFKISFYPGAVYQPKASTKVYGDLFQITEHADSLFSLLDDYEGIHPNEPETAEFKREIIPIHCKQELIFAHCYVYKGDYSELSIIKSGVFTAENS